MSPNQRETLSAISTITGKQEYITSTGGILNSGATLSGSAIPATGLTAAAAVQIVDGSGNQITSFGGGTQYTSGGSTPANPVGPTLEFDNGGTWATVSVANPLPVTASVTISGVATAANQTNGTQQTKITDGTNIASVLKSDGTAAAQNSQMIAGTYLPVSFSATSVQVVGSTDAGNYGWVSVQIVTQGGSSTVTWQTSNDNTNWQGLALVNTNSAASSAAVNTTGVAIFHGPLPGRYFRLSISGIVSGTTAGTIQFFTTAKAMQTLGATVVGTTTTAADALGTTTSAIYASSVGLVYNGTSFDRARSASTANGTTGTGLLGTGIMGYDGTDYRRILTDTSGNLGVTVNAGSNVIGQVELTDGTNIANTLKSDGTAAGQNSQLTARTYLSVAFTTTTAQAVGATDAANYSSVSVHIVTQGGSSLVSFQGSNDNTNWVSVALLNSVAVGTTPPSVSSSTAGIIYAGSVNFRYFRLNVTGIATGTTAGVIEFFTNTYAANSSALAALQSGTWAVGASSATGSAPPANAFYVGMNGGGSLLTGMQAASVLGDASNGNALLANEGYIYNGTTSDRMRSATSVSGTTGTGLLGAGILGFDGTDYQHISTNTSGVLLAGTASAVVNVGQKTVNTTPVQISASSTIPTNGIIVRALSTNAASIFVGGSGVTTSSGFELVAGESMSFTANLNTLYIISVASTTDGVCYNVE